MPLFKPAIRFENLFVRADILVKAKSYNSSNQEIVGARGDLTSDIRPYIEDVAFQVHVLR